MKEQTLQNQTENLSNGDKTMNEPNLLKTTNESDNVSNGKNALKFNPYELTAIDKFTEDFKKCADAYEVTHRKMDQKISIDNDNVFSAFLHGGFSIISLLKNKDTNKREFHLELQIEDAYDSLDKGCIYEQIEEALEVALEFLDEHIASRFDIGPVLERGKIVDFEQKDLEYIDEFSKEFEEYFAKHFGEYLRQKTIFYLYGKDDSRNHIEIVEEKLDYNLVKYHNELTISCLRIEINLIVDKTNYEGRRIYVLKESLRYDDESPTVFYYQNIEEALQELFYRFKINLKKGLENNESSWLTDPYITTCFPQL